MRGFGILAVVAAALVANVSEAGKVAHVYVRQGQDEKVFREEFDGAFELLKLETDKYLAGDEAALAGKLGEYELVIVGNAVRANDLVFSAEDVGKWKAWFEAGGALIVTDVNYPDCIENWFGSFGDDFKLDPQRHCTAYSEPTMANQKMTIDRDAFLEFPRDLGRAIELRGKHWSHFANPSKGWKMPIRCIDGLGLLAYREVGNGLVVYTNIWDLRGYGAALTAKFIENALCYTRLRKAGFRPLFTPNARLALENAGTAKRRLMVKTSTGDESADIKTVALKPGDKIELFPEAKRKAFGDVVRRLQVSEGSKEVLAMEWRESIPAPVTVEIAKDHVFKGDTVVAEVSGNPIGAKSGKVVGVEWKVDDGKWTLAKGGLPQRLAIPVGSCKPGKHAIVCRLKVLGDFSAKKSIGEASFTVHDGVPHASVRADGTVLKDGQPFFPFGFYDVILWNPAEPVRSELVKNLGDWGYNAVHLAVKRGEDDPGNKVYDEFLDLCQAKGVNLVATYVPDYDTNLIKRAAERFGKHPAVLGWSIYDEPAANNFPADEFARACGYIREFSPDRLTYTVFCLPGQLFRYSPYAGALATDPYPDVGDVDCIWKNLKASHDGIALGGASQWVCLQAHGGQNHSTPEVSPRLFRSQAYMAIMAGAKGILYYTYRDFRFILTSASAELQAAVAEFPKEFSQMFPYVLDGKLTVVSSGEKGKLYAATWEKDGKTVYVAVNAGREGVVEATVPFKGGKVLHKDETVEVSKASAGAMSLKLGPLDRIVITK